MDDLVLVKKATRAEILENARTGRPSRTTFALRHYGGNCILALPHGACGETDGIDFFLSNAGFAVQIGPDGERTISGKKNSRTAAVPLEVRKKLDGLADGSHELIADERPGGLWFFPFSQFE
jgi:hypothetical protein